MAESIFRGAVEAPSRAGARAAGEGGGAAHVVLTDQIAHLAIVLGSGAQEEARVRAIRKAHLWAALRKQTAGTPALSRIMEELKTLDLVSVVTLLSFIRP